VSQSRQVSKGGRRPAPPPREASDFQVTATITLGWVLALVVLLSVYAVLPAQERWWLWTCVAGVAMGLFGLWYVPFLKRRRVTGRAQSPEEYVSRDSGSNTVSSTETPGSSTRS
jgi:membrane protein YdbS with pleckstrin-like domain